MISCGPDNSRLLRDAAIQKAIAEAEQAQPRAQLPARCKTPVPHAEVLPGSSLEGLIKLEQAQLDIANDVIVDCSKFNLG